MPRLPRWQVTSLSVLQTSRQQLLITYLRYKYKPKENFLKLMILSLAKAKGLDFKMMQLEKVIPIQISLFKQCISRPMKRLRQTPPRIWAVLDIQAKSRQHNRRRRLCQIPIKGLEYKTRSSIRKMRPNSKKEVSNHFRSIQSKNI